MPLNVENILKSCRLCQVQPGTLQFIDNQEFINQVFECTNIKINNEHMHLLPKNVCQSCKLSIEEFFVFLKDIRLVDQKLKDQILNCDNSDAKLLKCNECTSNSLNNDVLQKQIKRKFEYKKHFKCPACSKTYARYKNLQLHKRTHVNLYCSKCDIIFNDLVACKNHYCNTLKNSFEYKDCGNVKPPTQERTNFDNVKNTFEIETKEVKKEWFEDEFPVKNKDVKIDDNVTKTEPDVEVVSDTSHGQLVEVDVNLKNKPKGSYICEVCNKSCLSNADLRVHQKIHGITFSCTFGNCTKVCTSAYTLKTHLMRHEGKMPFLCVTCGKGFTTKNSLNCHEQTHAKVKGYACKECNIGFSVASNLRAHQKKHHEGVRFYCSQCTRAFITKCSLERHELVHTGVKEFKCESCNAAFYTNKELLKHQRYHQGLRLYKCDQCYKTFFEKHHLTIHIRVHTGERPYACKVVGCGKSFTESQKLSRHMKARHPPI